MSTKPNLTLRQANVLNFIRDFVRDQGISPTLEEIGHSLGVNRVTVFEHVRALEAKGWIKTSRQQSRSIQIISEDAESRVVPVLGRIAAGAPIEAISNREVFDLDDFVPPDRDCFMLRVQGESMIEDQIRDGDFVLVDPRVNARAGETVVALIDGEVATLKRYYPMGSKVRLEPRNRTIKPLVVKSERIAIQGVVIGVFRKY